MTAMVESEKRYRAVILTALSVEYAAVRRHLDASTIKETIHAQGTVYEVGTFNGAKAGWDICLVEVGAGNSAAAFEAERAIATFKPAVALFVGIAGGIKDVAIGDIVFATKIYGYESGKDVLNFQPRPDVGESTYALGQRARAEARKFSWMERLQNLSPNLTPKVFVGALAAGEKVVASTRSRTFAFLKESYGDSLAVEMEGRGFLSVLHANRQVEAGVVRGISDLIDDKNVVELKGTQELASAHASAFAFQLLDQFDVSDGASDLVDNGAQVRYVVLISGQFDEKNVSFAKAAFEFLKHRAKDPTMVLEKIEAGSIVLCIKGTLAGFQRLVVDFKSGKFDKVGDHEIIGVIFGSVIGDQGKAGNSADETSRKVNYKIAELEEEGFAELYPKLVIMARHLLGRLHETETGVAADDLVNEALVRYLNGTRIRPPEVSLYKFLVGVMRSVASSQRNKHSTEVSHFGQRVANFSEADFIIDTLVQPGTELSTAETLSLVRGALRERPIDLAVFNVILEGEISRQGIAEQLGLTPTQVDNSRHYLRRVVSRLLDDRVLMARYT